MNIIVVAKFLKSPKKLSLRDPLVMASVASAVVLIAGFGVALGCFISSSENAALAEAKALRGEVREQQQQLDGARAATERDVNAIAARVGELQAQATRLNALGARLTQVAHLDPGEFDFSDSPALGGPDSADEAGLISEPSLQVSLDAMAQRLARQAQQLSVLESLLLDSDVDTDLLPAGLPVRSGYASSPFGMRIDPITGRREFHSGVDFNGQRGTDILAVADGVVAFSGRHNSYGNMVDIDHGNGYVTRYAHNHLNMVKPGERVRAGEVIAKMGSTGRVTGTHVHFEVWNNDRAVNPHQFLTGQRG
ncbi:MAG: peptidoglycan DD-metalloendopeptidase family protein [Pseudomarimonas sp.]